MGRPREFDETAVLNGATSSADKLVRVVADIFRAHGPAWRHRERGPESGTQGEPVGLITGWGQASHALTRSNDVHEHVRADEPPSVAGSGSELLQGLRERLLLRLDAGEVRRTRGGHGFGNGSSGCRIRGPPQLSR